MHHRRAIFAVEGTFLVQEIFANIAGRRASFADWFLTFVADWHLIALFAQTLSTTTAVAPVRVEALETCIEDWS